jgi:hypothetical protein
MKPSRGICQFCGSAVMETDTAAYRIMGWEIERDGGGANQIVGREREPNMIFHETCVRQHVRSPGGVQLALHDRS